MFQIIFICLICLAYSASINYEVLPHHPGVVSTYIVVMKPSHIEKDEETHLDDIIYRQYTYLYPNTKEPNTMRYVFNREKGTLLQLVQNFRQENVFVKISPTLKIRKNIPNYFEEATDSGSYYRYPSQANSIQPHFPQVVPFVPLPIQLLPHYLERPYKENAFTQGNLWISEKNIFIKRDKRNPSLATKSLPLALEKGLPFDTVNEISENIFPLSGVIRKGLEPDLDSKEQEGVKDVEELLSSK